MDLSDLVYYDETSTTCLRWKVDRFSGHHGKIKSANAGDVAGSLDARKECYTTRYEGKAVKAHSVVAELHGLRAECGYVVDHLDGDPTNNRIANLRIVSNVINSHNRRKQHNNTSGATGVHKWTDRRGGVFWMARWQDSIVKRGEKSFSISKYGTTGAYEMAVAHRTAMILKLTKDGHGYTSRHGK